MRCVAGDLAIIVIPIECVDNGRFVRVIERSDPCVEERWGIPCWRCEATDGGTMDSLGGPARICSLADAFLLPIRGQQLPEQITTTAPELART